MLVYQRVAIIRNQLDNHEINFETSGSRDFFIPWFRMFRTSTSNDLNDLRTFLSDGPHVEKIDPLETTWWLAEVDLDGDGSWKVHPLVGFHRHGFLISGGSKSNFSRSHLLRYAWKIILATQVRWHEIAMSKVVVFPLKNLHVQPFSWLNYA